MPRARRKPKKKRKLKAGARVKRGLRKARRRVGKGLISVGKRTA